MGEIAQTHQCPRCAADLSLEARYCSQCGQALEQPSGGVEPPKPKWYYNVWFVLLMLFFVMGPFGLPLVWKNPKFARWAKIALTLAMVLYTVWLVELTMKMVHAVLQGVDQFNATLQF